MTWPILIAYVVVAELIIFSWVLGSFWFGYKIPKPVFDAFLLPTSQRLCFYAWQGLLLFISAPIVLPLLLIDLILIKLNGQKRKEHEKKFGHHVEASLDPLHPLNMPTDLEDYIQEHRSAAIAMNYESLGDYWLRGEPYNGKARIFISDDQTSFAEIGVILNTLYCEITSFLEDGSLVSTANCQPIRGPRLFESYGWYLNLIGEADMLQTIEAHSKFLEEAVRRSWYSVQKISRENWKEYFHYQKRKHSQIRFELGEINTAPASCKIPWEQQEEVKQQTNLVGQV